MLPANTVTLKDAPGITVPAGQTTGGGVSSVVIVPCPWPSPRSAPEAPDRFTKKVSVASGDVSPLTSTVTVFVLSPAAKLRDPEPAA